MHTRRSLSEGQTAMVLVTPAFLLIFALGIVPVVCVIVFSLGKVQPALLTWSYMGLDNYAEVLKDSSFWSSLGITLYFTVVSVLLQLVIWIHDRHAAESGVQGTLVGANPGYAPMGGAHGGQRQPVEMDFERQLWRT